MGQGRLLLALAALLFAASGFGGCSASSDDSPLEIALAESEDSIDADSVDVDPLVAQFTPVVWIHRGEAYGPTSARRFLARSELTWRTGSILKSDPDLAGEGKVEAARLGEQCVRAARGCYAHGGYLATDFTRPHDSRSDRVPRLSAGDGFYLDLNNHARKGEVGIEPQAPMYYEIDRYRRSTRITYWFFYAFSAPYARIGPVDIGRRISHEGDWENVDVILDVDGTPREIFYHGHGHVRPIAWDDACKLLTDGEEDCASAEPGRPIVYSARDSHASYPVEAEAKSKETEVCYKRSRRLCSHDMRNRGFVWDVLAPEAKGLRNARVEPWYGFGGAWGSAGPTIELTGPVGPSTYKLPGEPEPGELRAVTAPEPGGG